MAPIIARYPHLERDIRTAQFNTASWYFKKAFLDDDYAQLKKLAPMMVRKYSLQLIVHGVQQGWRQTKRQGIRMARHVLGKPSRPKKRFAAEIPQTGTAFSDRFTAIPAEQAISPTSSRTAGHE
jgi:hypothetical protein